ncbi:hypothetical protein OHA21_07805 [Actinoplanes sp. NBC_00393]|uniref:hypothetical protein n=1 Tax=Actinoplanes sp. NBC_00393 TaxID=2975953 RepID=UPI002E205248
MRTSRLGRAYLAAALLGISLGISGIPQANAYTDVVATTCMASKTNPTMTFDKGTAPYGTFYAFYSGSVYCGSTLMANRHKITMKGGSGDGTSNECTTNRGWLPNGKYNARYEKNHQTDSAVVKGSVWNLGNKTCAAGTVTRTELFIHSQGGNGGGWSESNYKSAGCIKINQTDRSFLKDLFDIPIYGAANNTLNVVP